MRFGKIDDIKSRVAAAIDASRRFLFSIQDREDGYWCGELGADTTLVSDYILLHRLLGTEIGAHAEVCHGNSEPAECRWRLADLQRGPSNVSASVKAYFALKMAGYRPDHPQLQKARERILALGGVTEVNTFTKIYLCFLGQYDYDAVPAIPPEIVLFPNWFWFNLYEISSWSRAILVPLSIAYAKKPFKKIPDEEGIDELFVGGRRRASLRLRWAKKLISWRNFFLVLDRLIHFFERVHVRPLRSQALKVAEKWMLERLEMSDGLGAIYPGIMNSIIALRCLGYSLDDPQVIRAMDEFEKLGIEEETTFRMQPCMSPVWDTAYAVFALAESGVPANDPRLVQPCEWMLKKQVTRKGDWCVKNPKAAPAGWYFEFNNEFYPDVDDSAQVLLALSRVKTSNESYHDQVGTARAGLDPVDAVQERRLGVVRQRQRPHGLPAHSVCRSQRHARSGDGRHHRPRAGVPGDLRLLAERRAGAARGGIYQARAGA